MAVCHLVQVFALPAQQQAPLFPLESVAHHNRLGLFLFALTRSCKDHGGRDGQAVPSTMSSRRPVNSSSSASPLSACSSLQLTGSLSNSIRVDASVLLML